MSDETRGSSRGGQHLDLVLDADPAVLSSVRARVADWLQQHRWPEQRTGEVVVAVNEAITNSIQHAYGGLGGRIALRAEVTVPFPGMGIATFSVRDRGRWRHQRPPRDGPGHGLKILRGLMDEVRIDSGAAGTTVVFCTPVVALRSP
jgi:serine/threonine-protein kinase RsbW